MLIISFDPGGTTGVATWDSTTAGEDEHHPNDWEWEELTGDHHMALFHLLLTSNPDHVVYERFNYQRRDITKGVSLRLDSVEYIGVIKLCKQRAAYWGNTDFILHPQQPSQRTWWTDARLRALGLWRSSEHERDATRHLLRYVTQELNDKRFVNALPRA